MNRSIDRLGHAAWPCIAVSAGILAAGQLLAICPNPAIGPDIVVADITDSANYGQVGGIRAYSLRDNTCNFGNANVSFALNTPQHPVMVQNMYRLSTVNGAARMEQIGMSWAYHEFASLAGTLYCSCSAPGMPSQFIMYPGCSSTNAQGQTGSSSNLGPRSEINAFTGAFPFPFSSPAVPPTIGRRLQVHESDIDPALNPGAQYFLEAYELSADDAAAGNILNNQTYRSITIGATPFNLTLTSSSQLGKAAISAWKTADPTVTETIVQVPGEGRYILAAKATPLGGGVWHYEYALYNFNSDRSVGLISILLPAVFPPANVGFHDVDYHSGDPSVGTDWTPSIGGGSVTWACETFAQNPNANALRWGTLYNFRFDATIAPKPGGGLVTLGLFKPGSPTTITAATVVPDQFTCAGDTNHNGLVNIDDLVSVITSWGNCPAQPTACPGDVSPQGGDGAVNIDDLVRIITSWGACP